MLEYCSETTKNREEFIEKVEQPYSHPYESSLDEIGLTDGPSWKGTRRPS